MRVICFNTQPPEGGWAATATEVVGSNGFNTQPPEGGWGSGQSVGGGAGSFNTQPPEGGWVCMPVCITTVTAFQHTAARRRLGMPRSLETKAALVSTHSRPKAAGAVFVEAVGKYVVSTHSRPKAAGERKRRPGGF